jgi:hypothetical protein
VTMNKGSKLCIISDEISISMLKNQAPIYSWEFGLVYCHSVTLWLILVSMRLLYARNHKS